MKNKFDQISTQRAGAALGSDTASAATGDALTKATKTSNRGNRQTEATELEKQLRRKTGHTQGRQGCKAKRINLAFYDDNHEYISRMSRAYGMSKTEFINKIVAEYRREHPEAMREALADMAEVTEAETPETTADELRALLSAYRYALDELQTNEHKLIAEAAEKYDKKMHSNR